MLRVPPAPSPRTPSRSVTPRAGAPRPAPPASPWGTIVTWAPRRWSAYRRMRRGGRRASSSSRARRTLRSSPRPTTRSTGTGLRTGPGGLTRSRPITVAGRPAREIRFKKPHGEPYYALRDVWIPAEGGAYIVTCQTFADSYRTVKGQQVALEDLYAPAFDSIIQGFVIMGQAPPTPGAQETGVAETTARANGRDAERHATTHAGRSRERTPSGLQFCGLRRRPHCRLDLADDADTTTMAFGSAPGCRWARRCPSR